MNSVSQEELDRLRALYDQGRVEEVVSLGTTLGERDGGSIALSSLVGAAHARLGRLPSAIAWFERAVEIDPCSLDGQCNLGSALAEAGRHDEALAAFRRALALRSDWAPAHKGIAVALERAGRPDEAMASLADWLTISPGWPEAEFMLGRLLQATGRHAEAVGHFETVTRAMPDLADGHHALATACAAVGRSEEAVASHRRAIEIAPGWAAAQVDLANLLAELGRDDEALACYARSVDLAPDFAVAHYNLGNLLKKTGRHDDAAASYRRAVAISPGLAEAHNNLALALDAAGRSEEAVAQYRTAIAAAPDRSVLHFNLGNLLQRLGRDDEAVACYESALALAPGAADTHNNRASSLIKLGRLDEAMAGYERAIALSPDLAEAHCNLAVLLSGARRRIEAIASFERALAIRPGFAAARADMLHQRAHICDWAGIAANADWIATLGVEGDAVSPFAMLALEDDAGRHRIRSERCAAERFGERPGVSFARPKTRPPRLRIGYFSADFHDHATMYLMARLFEQHDAERFAIHAYSFGPDSEGAMRRRLIAAVDAFRDVREHRDGDIARLARDDGIDIAIDLKGYTTDSRTGIFMHRAAPIQIAYLGYPGTMGAPFIDYMIADRTVVPDSHRRYYSERILYLPGSYQANDDSRAISTRPVSRREAGLPDEGFVFCCFNNNYKITPVEFDIWMRLLRAVPGSVLWLLKSNPWSPDNLRMEARRRAVDPARLVFAEQAPLPDHLARHRLADLFLDTFACNAHTTTSDALWAGLPVLTKIGESFAARVAASLLNALDLPELVAPSPEAYESLALELARDPARLGEIGRRLAASRARSSLFDSAAFVRKIECGFDMVWDHHLRGSLPDVVEVPEGAR